MPSLRKIIDSQTKAVRIEQPFKPTDQVIMRKNLGRGGPVTREVMVGTIAAMSGDAAAIVSFPRPGGRILRSTVPLSQLEHVSGTFKRNSVQFNPAFRGVYLGSV